MSRFSTAWAAITAVLVLAFVAGCGGKTTKSLRGNLRPTVRLTQAPIDTSQVDASGNRLRYFYAYRMDWSGFDPDGRVDHYLYAIDPPDDQQVAAGQDTAWVETTNHEEVLFFQATRPDPGDNVSQSSDYHTFVIKAIDNRGAASEPVWRSFYSFTVAPTVTIRTPSLSRDVNRIISPSVRITWEGQDTDGQLTQRPVRYLYRLFTELGGAQNDPETDLALFAESNPRAFRDSMIATGFPGFRSTPAESAFAQYTDLPPSVTGSGSTRSTRSYLFIVVAIDEAGSFSTEMSRNSNMLKLSVGFFGALGPTFTVFNEFIQFQYPGAGFGYDDRNCSLLDVEVPSGRPITWNWFATATSGASIVGYRWALDLDDPFNEDPRSDEQTDLTHWSQFDPGVVSAALPAFNSPGRHELKVEAIDNNGLKSSACIRFTVVVPSFDGSANGRILVVKDTRLEFDRFSTVGGVLDTIPRPYSNPFPSQTELDTMLFAVGNVPVRRIQRGNPPRNSVPGIFHGWRVDSLGTKRGYEDPGRAVPLSKLFTYSYVVWIVDQVSGGFNNPGTDPNFPITTLRHVSSPGRANVLATYFGAGGRVWLFGGGAAAASTLPWYGLPGHPIQTIPEGGKLYRFLEDGRGELGPGRLMYDVAGWQAEFVAGGASPQLHPLRLDPAVPRNYPGAPDRTHLPSLMRLRVQGSVPSEDLPVRRSEFDQFYNDFSAQNPEYITARTSVTDDNFVPVLDTLMVLDRDYGVLRQDFNSPSWVIPVMTYYHPNVGGTCVMTGFAPWDFLRADQLELVRFVLEGVWRVTPDPSGGGVGVGGLRSSGGIATARSGRSTPVTPVTPAQRSARAGLPNLPDGGRR